MGGLKSSYDYVISAVDKFFHQQGPSTVTPMEEACELQVSWSTDELFR